MKKLIFNYLNELYPNAYIYECKFGRYPSFKGELLVYGLLTDEVVDFLGGELEGDFVRSTVVSWAYSLPVVSNIKNSTNPNVLVFK